MNGYLPADAVAFLTAVATSKPWFFGLSLAAAGCSAYWLLHLRFKRHGGDLWVAASIITAVLVFCGACVYLLLTRPGYHVG